MKRLGVFLLPPDGMLVHHRITPSIKFTNTHLYTWVEKDTVRAKCLAQEHNTMSTARSPARPRTRTTQSGVERTHHEVRVPPREAGKYLEKNLLKKNREPTPSLGIKPRPYRWEVSALTLVPSLKQNNSIEKGQ